MCTTIIEEEWRDIAGYEGIYQVSNLGRVKSLNYRHTGNEQILKPWKNNNGYLEVQLYKNCKIDHQYVHRLVAKSFIQNPDNHLEVNHKDENPSNNRVDNLEWCDSKYNNNYGARTEKAAKSLLNRKDKSKSVLCVETGTVYASLKEASRQTGASFGNICLCCQGKLKTTRGFHWQYAD